MRRAFHHLLEVSVRRATLLIASTFVLAAASATLLLPPIAAPAKGLTRGAPGIKSMSALAFGHEGVLFIGDGKSGAVFAVDVGDREPRDSEEAISIRDIETKIGARLGTDPGLVMIHDMAVNPISQNIYLAVSRGRGDWKSAWMLPNDVADASILLRIGPDGAIHEVTLKEVPYARATLPNPVDPAKTHKWKEGISLRTDTITDLAYQDGVLYVTGLSNEEFASTLWRVPYPFDGEGTTATTLEVYHGAHGEYETHAPIRTFLPYRLNDEAQLLAAYLCTPFVTFKVSDLGDKKHVKGRTLAEFGYGNYPLDMILYKKGGKDRILIANSNLPLMIVRTEDIASHQGAITAPVEEYTAGLKYEIRSGAGVQQLDNLNGKNVVALVRTAAGLMNLESLPVERF